jgi:hypothetical protein
MRTPPGVIETVLLCENFDSGPAGWLPVDVDSTSYPDTHYWHLDPTITSDTGAWSLSKTDPCYAISPGYGNNWRMFLEKTFTTPGGGSLSGYVDMSYKIDTESGFDYFYIEVLPEGASDWDILHAESGENLAGATGQLNFGPYAGASSVMVRVRFESDDVFSQEDGQVTTTLGSAVVVDDVTVSVTGSGGTVVTTDDFTTGGEGWTPGQMPIAPTLATFRLEAEPDCTPVPYILDLGIGELNCDHPAPCAPYASPNKAWTATDLGTGVITEIPEDYSRLFIPGIQSPVIPMAPIVGTQEYFIELDVFSDQNFANTRLVWQYDFAFTFPGDPCPSDFVKSHSWKSHGPPVGWHTLSNPITQYISYGADGIIVRLNIADWVNLTNATPGDGGRGRGAYFDNVKVIRLTAPPGPPILECNASVAWYAEDCDTLVPLIEIDHPAIKMVLDDTTPRDQLVVNQSPAAGTLATLPFDVTLSITDLDANTSNSCTVTFYSLDCGNDPPVITCPSPVTLECNSENFDSLLTAFLDGATATDDFDPDPAITNDAPDPFPVGTTDVVFTATDNVGASAACTSSVTIEDHEPPEINVVWNRYDLWPPNHKMVDIMPLTFEITDACCDVEWVLEDVISDEPDNGRGDGNTVGDIALADTGTTDNEFQLRSERSAKGDGRTYTIIYRAWDCEGNVAKDTSYIHVPHDRQHPAFAAYGFTTDGTALDDDSRTFIVAIPATQAEYESKGNRELLIKPEVIASAIDVSRTYVGNTGGALRPLRSRLMDVNGDGLEDLLLTYATDAAASIPVGNWLSPLDGLDEYADHGSLGLHFIGQDGTPFLVNDIFALGTPITVREGDDPSVEDKGQPGLGAASSAEKPKTYDTDLASIYPNPFNPSTTVRYTLAKASDVTIAVYDVRGALVRVLVKGSVPGGEHFAEWDGTDTRGRSVATGIYFAHMTSGSFEKSQKMVLLK